MIRSPPARESAKGKTYPQFPLKGGSIMTKFIVRSEGAAVSDKDAIEAVLRSFPFPSQYLSESIPKPYGLTSFFSVPKHPVCNVEELPLILRVEDLVRITGCSKQYCYNLCRIHGFPAYRADNSSIYLIPRDDFFVWLKDNALKS